MTEQKKIRRVAEQALQDIAEYLKDDLEKDSHNIDKLIVSAAQLNTKMTRYLNRLLNLHAVNKSKK